MSVSDAGRIVFEEANLYVACLLLHVVVWRVRRPRTFHQWLPALAVIFLGGGVLIGWWFSNLAHDGELFGHGRVLHFVGLMALHLPASLVYIIGYTLISSFSPSVELLKLLASNPDGRRRDEIVLPYLGTIVGGDRLKNLVSEGMFEVRRDVVRLGPKADRIVRLVLWYRHMVGLPDGTGG